MSPYGLIFLWEWMKYLCFFVCFMVEFDRPFNIEFISKHPELRAPWAVIHRHFNYTVYRKPGKYLVSFFTTCRINRYFRSIFVFTHWTQTFRNVVGYQSISANRQNNTHDFIYIVLWHREIRTF